MLPRLRRLIVVLLIGGMPLLGAAPASAQLDGSCLASFNGVDVDRIDSLDSPLELGSDDVLVFQGTSDAGTSSARVEMVIGPVTIESNTTTYATPASEFSASIPLDDVSPYGVGLFRVVGTVDGCVAEVWVRVSGRFPLATLTGLTALGLTLGGVTGQLGAIVSRRRWSRSAAALGGVATGAGIAVIAQQFGRLQISYPSVAAAALAAATLGFLASWILNPALREDRLDRKRTLADVAPTHVPTPAPRPERRDPAPAATQAPAEAARRSATPPATETATTPEPNRDASPYWCYVMAPTDVFGLTDHTRTVATLTPGTWYLAKRTVGGWAHVVASNGDEGWVAESAIHRQG